MNTIRFTCLTILLGFFGMLVKADIAAQDPPAPLPRESAEPDLLPLEAARPPLLANPGPLYERIAAVVEAEQVAAADLQARIDAATDDEELAALQRELEALKKETRVEILRVQADFAREEGRLEQAEAIEAAIENLRNPPRLPVRTTESTGPDKAAGTGR